MTKFCPGCGASVPAPTSFCAQCGRRLEVSAPAPSSPGASQTQRPMTPQWSTAPVPPPHPAAQQRSTGIGRILLIGLIIVGVILVGIAGAGYYAVRRVKQKVEQVRAEYAADQPLVTGRAALGGRTACDLLGRAEFRRVTGVVVAELVPEESGSELTCEYFTARPKEVGTGRKPVRVDDIQNARQALDAVQSAVTEAASRAPVLRVTIHLANAKAVMLGSRLAAGVTAANSRIESLGDEAYMDGTGSMLAARKGNRSLVLTMPLLPRSRDTGPVIAKEILDQI
jgi:hypothetical protein